MSSTAKGTIADTITFSANRKTQYAKRHVRHPDAASSAQLLNRFMFTWLAEQSATLTGAEAQSYEAPAALDKVSPYNAYIGANLARWADYLPPSKNFTPDPLKLPASTNLIQVTRSANNWNLWHQTSNLKQGWATIFFASTTAAFTPEKADAILFDLPATGAPHFITWPAPDAQAYYFRLRPFSIGGQWGNYSDWFPKPPP